MLWKSGKSDCVSSHLPTPFPLSSPVIYSLIKRMSSSIMAKNNICSMTLCRHFSVTGNSSKTDLAEQQACTHKQAWHVMLISAELSFTISNK